MIISLSTSHLANRFGNSGLYLAILNAFVVYLASAGTSGAGAAMLPDAPPEATESSSNREDRRILRPWL